MRSSVGRFSFGDYAAREYLLDSLIEVPSHHIDGTWRALVLCLSLELFQRWDFLVLELTKEEVAQPFRFAGYYQTGGPRLEFVWFLRAGESVYVGSMASNEDKVAQVSLYETGLVPRPYRIFKRLERRVFI